MRCLKSIVELNKPFKLDRDEVRVNFPDFIEQQYCKMCNSLVEDIILQSIVLKEVIDLNNLTSLAKQLMCGHFKYDFKSFKNNKTKVPSYIPEVYLIEDKMVQCFMLITI